MLLTEYGINICSAFEVSNMVEMRKDLAIYQNFTAPGVKMHCLLGKDVETPEKYSIT